MFCPKCGTQNPDEGKFCRSCGTDLSPISGALAPKAVPVLDRKGRPITIDKAIVKIFTGVAFLAVTIALWFSGSGNNWWFWLLIPAFSSFGAGIAEYMKIREARKENIAIQPAPASAVIGQGRNEMLPPSRTDYVSSDSRYKTGDLVPPSVVEGTTRHLKMESEDETRALPKDQS